MLQSRLADRDAPIDSVTPDIADEAGFAREAEAARRLGFGGKLLIHPLQVAAARRIFAPSDAEVAWAKKVVGGLEAGSAGGALVLDGRMVDKPVADAARKILALRREIQS